MKAIIDQAADIVACVQALEQGPSMNNSVALTYCNLTLRPLGLAVGSESGKDSDPASSTDTIVVSLFGEGFLGTLQQSGSIPPSNHKNERSGGCFLRSAKNLWLRNISGQLPLGGDVF